MDLAAALRPLFVAGSPERTAQLDGIAEVKAKLGGPGAARRAAEIARSFLAA